MERVEKHERAALAMPRIEKDDVVLRGVVELRVCGKKFVGTHVWVHLADAKDKNVRMT